MAAARPPDFPGLLLLAAIAATAATLAFIANNAVPFETIFWHLLRVQDMPGAWLMLGLLVLAYLLRDRLPADLAAVDRLLLALYATRHRIVALFWLALCAGSLWLYRDHPLSMDEYAALFQARVFAAGELHGRFPPELLDHLLPRNFQGSFFLVAPTTGVVVSSYLPGFSLLLTPFVAAGIPWACNPTLTALALWLIGRFAFALSGCGRTAGLAILLALASPAFVANGISYYSMPAHLLLNLAFAALLLAPTAPRLVAAGVVGGLAAVLHNPFPHLVFALPWVVWLAWRGPGRGRRLFCLGLGYLPVVLVLGVGWTLWQKQVLAVPPPAATVSAAAVTVPAVAPAATVSGRLLESLGRVSRLPRWPDADLLKARAGGLAKLWLWSAPLLLLLAGFGARERWRQAAVAPLAASLLLTFAAYFFIHFNQGHGWGYRYFHSAWAPLAILGALGAIGLQARQADRTLVAVVALALASLVLANGLRLAQIGGFVDQHLAQMPPRLPVERQLRFHNGLGYYAADLIQNDPWLRGPEIVMLGGRRQREALVAEHFPGWVEAASNRFGATYVPAPPASSRR